MIALLLLGCTSPTVGLVRGDAPLWDPDAMPVFEIAIDGGDWLGELWSDTVADDPCHEIPYRPATVRFQNPATGETEEYADVGLRLRGNASLEAARSGAELPGLKLSWSEFVDDRALHGSRKINLLGSEGDFTLLREHLALALADELGLVAPDNAHALVYVNGELHGVMPYTEEPDDSAFVDRHFLGAEGSLYKASGYCGTRPPDLRWVSDDPEDYVLDYVPKAGTPPDALADDLIPMLDCATNTSDSEFAACIPEWIALDDFLVLVAMDHLLPDPDGMVGRAHNYMLFFDRGWDRFYPYFWDKDQTFYTHEMTGSSTVLDLDLVNDDETKPLLVSRLQAVFPEAYCEALARVHDATDPTRFGPRVESRGQFLWDAVAVDPRYDLTDWKYGVQGLLDTHEDWWALTGAQIEASCGAGVSAR
jgi:hypothetical protein